MPRILRSFVVSGACALSLGALGPIAGCAAGGATESEIIDDPDVTGLPDAAGLPDALPDTGDSGEDLDAAEESDAKDGSNPDAGDGDASVDDADIDAEAEGEVKGSLELCVLNAGGPLDLCETPEQLDFQIVPAGTERMRLFRIDNETLEDVTFEAAHVGHPDFSVVAVRYVHDPDDPGALPAREAVTLPTTRTAGTALYFEVTFTSKGETAGPVPADTVYVTATTASDDVSDIEVPIIGEQQACAEGFAACDADPKNGCETDTTSAVTDCGRCGTACFFENALAACVDSECQIGSCQSGFGNCDGDAENGCETNTQTSFAHCGACGEPCPAPALGAWSGCHPEANECSTTGLRRRTVTAHTCSGGGCVPTESEETEPCQRVTEGSSCGSGVVNGPWSACSRNTSNICNSSGTQSRTVTTHQCESQACQATATVENQGCAASTSGCHKLTSNTEWLTRRGKTGGTSYESACAAGSVATGLQIKYGTRIDQMILYCSPMNPDGTLGSSTTLPHAGGSGGGDSSTMLCDTGHVMVGIHGNVSTEITRVGPRCAPLNQWARTQTGSSTKGPSGNNVGTAFDDACSKGVVTRIDGNYGTWSNNPFASYTVVYSMRPLCTEVTVDP